jgi:hypothetical protein
MNILSSKSIIVGAIAMALSVAFVVGCGGKGTDESVVANNDPITGKFDREVAPSIYLPCAQGAYYRKIISSSDAWLGITGTVVLPYMTFDPARANTAKPGQYLDNPSVYMGGTADGQETDIGMTWEVIKDANGNVTADRRAFRPFLRRSAHTSTGQAATYENAPAQDDYYWYPGDTITMSVQTTTNGIIHFKIEGKGKKYERDFEADGFKPATAMQFKRVNAIDQVNNEGKAAQATKTKVTGSVWLSTYLYRSYNNSIVKAPIHKKRFTDMRCPSTDYFTISSTDAQAAIGGESIVIDGAGK